VCWGLLIVVVQEYALVQFLANLEVYLKLDNPVTIFGDGVNYEVVERSHGVWLCIIYPKIYAKNLLERKCVSVCPGKKVL